MFGLGTTELLVILALVLVLFGAAKIPQLGRGLGEGIRNFKKGLKTGDEEDAAANARPAARRDEQIVARRADDATSTTSGTTTSANDHATSDVRR